MSEWTVTFGEPVYLLGLLLLPLLGWLSVRSLSGLGGGRRAVAILLRGLVLAAIILALAETQWQWVSERLTVIYVLDQSDSIPPEKRSLMLDYVVREVARHRNAEREDRAGVIIFGRDALVEIPPFADDLPSVGQIEGFRDLRTDGTNLSAALKLAQASFPEDSAKRIVVISDGNENLGNARAAAHILADQGIGIDVLPIQWGARGEVAVDKIVVPSNARRGQPLESRVVLENFGTSEVPGKVTVMRQLGGRESLLQEFDVRLQPGKNVYSIREAEIESSGVFTYRAIFTADDPADDQLTANNEATGFTYVRGRGRALLIEDWEHPGDFDFLVNRLRASEIEVDVLPTNQLFTSLAELQAYDVVILANVPRSSGEDANTVTSFSDEQIQMLVQNTEHFGSGLIMLGGPNSFGVGGWANTELEKAMPVDFQIKNARVRAVGALVMMMHASEMAQGNYWQRVIGIEALKALGPMDYCGVVQWNDMAGREQWLWAQPQGMAQVGTMGRVMLARLNRVSPGDMPTFEPSMQMALAGLQSVNASMKHVIIISDGDPAPPSPATINAFRAAEIPISTVAVGTHGPAGSTPLQSIATATGGKYYVASNPRALPRIFQREARRVARPLIFEPPGGIQPQVVFDHEIHNLTGTELPPIRGFVLTTVKDNPLVEVTIRSPQPIEEENSTILANWTYGLGRSAVFTSDAGKRWTSSWTSWENYHPFFAQLVRWAMRPTEDRGRFSIATDLRDGKVRVVVNALDDEDQFLNLDELTGMVLGPEGDEPLRIQQVAPGRYVGEFPAHQMGNYFITVHTGSEEVEIEGRREQRNRAPLVSGISIPYSPEYRDRQANLALLQQLAAMRPRGGEPGVMMEDDLTRETLDTLTQTDTFRPTLARAVTSQDVWPWFLLVASVLFFFDVLVRRVAIGIEWLRLLLESARQRLRGDTTHEAVSEQLERLRSRKAEVTGQLDEQRAAARYVADPDNEPDLPLEDATSSAQPTREPPRKTTTPSLGSSPSSEEESYTARLLKAKQQASSRIPDRPSSGPHEK
jgi:uncharacterized membrane protein/Mg-chelatase subunit ChlD